MLRCSRQHRLAITAHLVVLLLRTLLAVAYSPCSNGGCQVLDSCSSSTDCGNGLYCGVCSATGKTRPLCVRGQATIPTRIIDRLPFNRYSWLVTHNSFSMEGTPNVGDNKRITFYNQEDTVRNQLLNGVRGLMLDMYDFLNDTWLCHSHHGQCFNYTAFRPAIDVLMEVEAFLSRNPREIVTILIEDYVKTPKALTKLFEKAALDKYMFPLSEMPKNGEDWPTIEYMVSKNYTLLVFTSVKSKEKTEGIAYQWGHIKENEPGDLGIAQNSCPNRRESMPLDSRALFLLNSFPTFPDKTGACRENSASLLERVRTCFNDARQTMPNFLAVNYYMRSDGGGVFDALDIMNGHNVCGCNTIVACQAGDTYGSCNSSLVATAPPATPSGSTFGYVQFSASIPSPLPLSLLSSLFTCSVTLLIDISISFI